METTPCNDLDADIREVCLQAHYLFNGLRRKDRAEKLAAVRRLCDMCNRIIDDNPDE